MKKKFSRYEKMFFAVIEALLSAGAATLGQHLLDGSHDITINIQGKEEKVALSLEGFDPHNIMVEYKSQNSFSKPSKHHKLRVKYIDSLSFPEYNVEFGLDDNAIEQIIDRSRKSDPDQVNIIKDVKEIIIRKRREENYDKV